MKRFTAGFNTHRSNYFWQPLLAASFVVITLVGLGGFKHVTLLGYIGTSSLGSTAYLVFGTPSAASASIKNMWGGYAVSVFFGAVFAFLISYIPHLTIHNNHYSLIEIAAMLAMAATMLIMALLRLEHPPAVGLALGLVVEPWTFYTLFIVLSMVCLMSLIKKMLRPWLVDLL